MIRKVSIFLIIATFSIIKTPNLIHNFVSTRVERFYRHLTYLRRYLRSIWYLSLYCYFALVSGKWMHTLGAIFQSKGMSTKISLYIFRKHINKGMFWAYDQFDICLFTGTLFLYREGGCALRGRFFGRKKGRAWKFLRTHFMLNVKPALPLLMIWFSTKLLERTN